ncbi:MAG: SDR family NAD(P)-dependent oxidoreductase [Thermoplasmatales archaeon]
MSKILITGGLGFIGSHTVSELVKQGYKVRILDNQELQVHGKKKHIENTKNIEFIDGDIRNRKSWLKALDGVNGVIHLAGAVGISQSFWQARKYMETNAVGTATLFEILTREKTLKNKIEKIVVASSKSIYGEGSYLCKTHGIVFPEPRSVDQLRSREWEVRCPICGETVSPVAVREDKVAQNLNPYSLSKYATEKLALDFSYSLNIPVVALRYFNVYGEGQSLSNPYTGVIAIFISRIKNGNPPIIFEDGNQSRDFIYVKDVAKINQLSLDRAEGPVNIGTGIPTSLNIVVKLINTGLSTNIMPNITKEFRTGDNRHDFADLTNFNRQFSSFTFTSLRKGMENLLEWARKEDSKDMVDRAERERKKFLT